MLYLRRWYCLEEGTPAKFAVRVWLDDDGGVLRYVTMWVHGRDQKGELIDRRVEGDAAVRAAFARFERNTTLEKQLIRDDIAEREQKQKRHR